MYVRRCYREKNGKRHAYWALVQSYRTARGPRQVVVAYLGELDEHGRIGVQQAVQPASTAQEHLFRPLSSSRSGSKSTSTACGWNAVVSLAAVGLDWRWVYLRFSRSCCRKGGKGFRGV